MEAFFLPSLSVRECVFTAEGLHSWMHGYVRLRTCFSSNHRHVLEATPMQNDRESFASRDSRQETCGSLVFGPGLVSASGALTILRGRDGFSKHLRDTNRGWNRERLTRDQTMALKEGGEHYTAFTFVENGEVKNRRLHRIDSRIARATSTSWKARTCQTSSRPTPVSDRRVIMLGRSFLSLKRRPDRSSPSGRPGRITGTFSTDWQRWCCS